LVKYALLFCFLFVSSFSTPTFITEPQQTKSKFSKEMLTAAEISSVSVTASYICFPTNISVLQQNKRQL